MKGDFTRDTFDPGKHFLRVLMQQGRVQVDADWNEQIAILLHYLQTLAKDLIGPKGHGGPAASCGFAILDGQDGDFGIGKGRYYVDGILCENPATAVSFEIPNATDQKLIKVTSLSPDGWPFQKDQYVEILSSTAPTSGILAKIDAVNTEEWTLQLNTDAPAGTKAIRRADTYRTQPDLPDSPGLDEGKYLVYLDVWERHISHLEDESIREVALGGPDTASRSKVIWQVKAHQLENQDTITCENAFEKLSPLPISTALLKAQTEKPAYPAAEEPCVLSPEARYRGTENRLYRIEIHRGGAAWNGISEDNGQPAGNADQAATFKWSRDNGSVLLAVKAMETDALAKTTKVTVASLGFGCEIRLAVGNWVEIVDDDSVLKNETNPLLRVITIDQIDKTVTLEGVSQGITRSDMPKHPLLRRWDFKPTKGSNAPEQADDKALLIEEGKWLTLENGVQIWFEKAEDGSRPHVYRTGDYWLIPAREQTGDLEWPKVDNEGPKALPPRGVHHHYAPLAILSVNSSGTTVVHTDCRCKFEPMPCLKSDGG